MSWSYVPPPSPVPQISVISTPSDLIYNPSASVSWSDTLEGMVKRNLGFAEANERKNESIPWTPVPRAKPPPRQLLLRWADRSFDSGATLTNKFSQINQFGWNLPENVSGFDSVTLFSATVNMTWFQNFGQYLGIQLDIDGAPLGSNMITTADGKNSATDKLVSPTWLVPNSGGSGAVDVTNISNMGSPDPRNSVWAINLRGRSFGSLTVTLGDESMLPLTYKGTPPATAFYFYMVLLLQ